MQAGVLAGSMHWLIRVVHLLMGLAAMGIAGTLGQAILATVPARGGRVPERGVATS
jgi:hypothetical protein